jgi:hypothetical protein
MNPDEMGTSRMLDSEAHACAYCGQPVDQKTLLSHAETPVRLSGGCFFCGPIYDIWLGGEKWLAADSVRSGATSRFTLNVRNPYQFPATAFAAVAIVEFGSRRPAACTAKALIEPGQTQPITLELELPADFFPGVYYARAFVIIGTSVSLFGRPIIVRGDRQ